MDILNEAHARLDAGDTAGAAGLLDGAGADVKASALWSYARGTVSMRQGDVRAAVRWFEAAVARDPLLPEPRANLGGALLELAKEGDTAALERARGLLEECCALQPKLPISHTNLGMAKLVAGDAKGAIEAFDKALKIDPKHVPALYDKAAALNALGRLDECLKALDATLAVDPTFQPAIDSRKSTVKRLAR
jgi:tetratricopeptide (TPR) repeat protein